jgi:hypothetical protein
LGKTSGEDKTHDDHEPDLFDYFDPLLSPHAYPDGISPDHKPQNPKQKQPSDQSTSWNPFFPSSEAETTASTKTSSSETNGSEEDLFDYFDPLLSPHAYPQGVSPSTKPDDLQQKQQTKNEKSKVVGILLMDHGSKKEASNTRLQSMAQLYQSSMLDEEYNNNKDSSTTVIVKAAHMEIASPSIPDGLKSLIDAGVDEIVCHPFFLSPDGRHVKEDIPTIIQDAITEMDIQIPVIVTEPVGANIKLMLGAIHSVVLDNSQVLKE